MLRLGERLLKADSTRFVFDATPLIHLTRAGLLKETLDLFEVYAPDTVIHEVTGDKSYPDAVILAEYVEKGLIRRCKPGDERLVSALLRHEGLHRGEAETLACAEELGAIAIIDDGVARSIAKIYGIPAQSGTLYVLFKLVAADRLDAAGAEEKLREMVKSGLYLDSKTTLAALGMLRDLGKEREN